MKKFKDDSNRTFGMEIEFADGDKTQIVLPTKYQWTDNDLTRMINSDGTNVTHSGNHGGEINTRPLTRSKEDLQEINDFIQHLKACGCNAIWNTGFDSHLFVRDLGVEPLKKMFELSYYIAPYIKKIFDIAEWFENKFVCPSPTYDYVEKVNRCTTFEEIINCFSNASHRGHVRFYLNIVPIIRLGTIEFRLFNTSFDFKETLETINFMYSYVEYVMTHDVEDFKKLNSIEKVIEAFNINPELTPKRTQPLLFAAEMTDYTTMLGKPERKTSKVLTEFAECVKGKRILLVNSFWMDIEQAFVNQEIKVFIKDVFTYSMYEVIKEDRVITFKNEFEFLNQFNDSREGNLACLIVFDKMKSMLSNSEYHREMWKNYFDTVEEKIMELKEKAKAIISRVQSDKITYCIGDVRNAIDEWKKGDIVVYQNEFNSKLRATSNSLMNFSDCTAFEKIKTDYHDLKIEKVDYVVFSKHSALGLKKVLMDYRNVLYSNIETKKRSFMNYRKIEQPKYRKIPMGYKLNKDSKIQFMRAKATELDYMRMMYLKKDILLGSGIYNYLWFVDGFLIGAMLFDYAKGSKSAGDLVWLKSDFVITSDTPKLSKLLIMAMKKKDFQFELNARFKTNIEEITTTVFTDKPISMKYRGVFNLHKRENGKLIYRTHLGLYANDKELVKDYLKRL